VIAVHEPLAGLDAGIDRLLPACRAGRPRRDLQMPPSLSLIEPLLELAQGQDDVPGVVQEGEIRWPERSGTSTSASTEGP
jgi:hypothetical protein